MQDKEITVYYGLVICTRCSRLKTDKIGNDTLCHVKRIKLKSDAPQLHWKNWDGVKVYTVSARYVEWDEFKRFPDNGKMKVLNSAISSALEEEPVNC